MDQKIIAMYFKWQLMTELEYVVNLRSDVMRWRNECFEVRKSYVVNRLQYTWNVNAWFNKHVKCERVKKTRRVFSLQFTSHIALKLIGIYSINKIENNLHWMCCCWRDSIFSNINFLVREDCSYSAMFVSTLIADHHIHQK